MTVYHCQDLCKFTALHLLYFLKDFDLERSSSLINEPGISSLLCISRELSQLSLTTISKQLKQVCCSTGMYFQVWIFTRYHVLSYRSGIKPKQGKPQIFQHCLSYCLGHIQVILYWIFQSQWLFQENKEITKNCHKVFTLNWQNCFVSINFVDLICIIQWMWAFTLGKKKKTVIKKFLCKTI